MPRTADKFAFFVEVAKQQTENKYTDEQLCELMTEHFPNFAGPHMINGYRRAYNKGLKPGFDAPASPLLKYDADGNAIPEGKRKVAAPKAAKTAAVDDEADKAEFEKIKENAAKVKAKKAAAKVEKTKTPAAPAAKKLVIKKK